MRPFAVHNLILASALLLGAGARGQHFDLQQQIDAAAPGDVITVPSGVHRGMFTITKPLTLVGQDRPVLDAEGKGHVIRIDSADVTIRGFTVRGTGETLDREHAGIFGSGERLVIENIIFDDVLFGVLLKNAPNSVIRECLIGGKDIDVARRGDGIRLWQCPGTLIEGNLVTRGRDVVVWFSSDVTLRRNTVSDGRYGMHFMYTDNNVLEENVLENNSVGAFLMYSRDLVLRRNVFSRNRGPSGYGLGLKDMERIVAEENAFVANRVGAYLDNSPHAIGVYDDFTRNVFAYNDIGLAFLPNVKRNRFTDNAFIENLQQVAVIGTGDFGGNEFTINGRGNYWSDYAGFDLDGDGAGDLPYEAASLFDNLIEREPMMRLFLHSPAQQAIDLAARAFPAVRPRPRFADTAPLMQPVRLDGLQRHQPAPIAMTIVAFVLLSGAAGLLLLTRTRNLEGAAS